MIDLLKRIEETEETHKAHEEFYELAEKYGFCTVWCEKYCALCEKNS